MGATETSSPYQCFAEDILIDGAPGLGLDQQPT